MTTLIFPLSRIEGHARVVMEEEDGKLLSAQFQAVELRLAGLKVDGLAPGAIEGEFEEVQAS